MLIGDGIENPHNALTMTQAAAMFGARCRFRDRAELGKKWPRELGPAPLQTTLEQLIEEHRPLVALDNAEGAAPLYGFRARDPTLVVGNERRGISGDALRHADYRIVIPMASRRVNTLNVAAASAVGLYYLARGGGGKLMTRANPNRNRPELLILAGRDHLEVGSTIRSAAAFGWRRVFIEDPGGIWFGCDRVTQSEGRAAARRGKNDIRIVPASPTRSYAFDRACIINTAEGRPLARTNLAMGPRQLIVLPDEESIDLTVEQLGRLAREVSLVRVEIPVGPEHYTYHFRLVATIALAESARQVGIRGPRGRQAPRPPVYDRMLADLSEEAGEVMTLAELADY